MACRDTARIIDLFKNKAPFSKIYLLGITSSNTKGVEISPSQFEDGLGVKIDYFIPFDRKSILTCLNQSKLIHQEFPRHQITKQLVDLCGNFTSNQIKKNNSTLWNLFK